LQGNHNADNIRQRCLLLREKLDSLQRAADQRKAKLIDNSAFLQFIWKTDVVESWIG
jgi:spectrin alpha